MQLVPLIGMGEESIKLLGFLYHLSRHKTTSFTPSELQNISHTNLVRAPECINMKNNSFSRVEFCKKYL